MSKQFLIKSLRRRSNCTLQPLCCCLGVLRDEQRKGAQHDSELAVTYFTVPILT